MVDSRNIMVDGCRMASEIGVKDLVFTDIDGSLDPSGIATKGALVSDYPHVTDILGGAACTSLDHCTAYCKDVCLRTFSYKVEQFGTENWKLRVSDVPRDLLHKAF